MACSSRCSSRFRRGAAGLPLAIIMSKMPSAVASHVWSDTKPGDTESMTYKRNADEKTVSIWNGRNESLPVSSQPIGNANGYGKLVFSIRTKKIAVTQSP